MCSLEFTKLSSQKLVTNITLLWKIFQMCHWAHLTSLHSKYLHMGLYTLQLRVFLHIVIELKYVQKNFSCTG